MPELARWARALNLSDPMVAAVRATLLAPRAWADRPGIGIGPYLRERRLANGVTLSRTAAELGLPLATLGHYESGRVEVPTSVLSSIVDRFAVGAVERAALCDGTAAFLEWCDSLVERPEQADEAISQAAYAVSPTEISDRGPAFIRLRTGLLRARLRGKPWDACEAFATSHHAHWLAVSERRAEAAAALASLNGDGGGYGPQTIVAMVTRRYLGRARLEEFLACAEAEHEDSLRAWALAEAALELCERRRGHDAVNHLQRARQLAERTGRWQEAWMRGRDAVRVSLRLRDWDTAKNALGEIEAMEPKDLGDDNWYLRQRHVLTARLEAHEATARAASA